MSITDEIASGQGIYLSAAARLFPSYRLGRPVSLQCVLRWVVDGVRGPEGRRIHLEAARLSGKWVTTPAAISRFIGAQSQNPSSENDSPASRPTVSQRRREAALAAKELERLGI